MTTPPKPIEDTRVTRHTAKMFRTAFSKIMEDATEAVRLIRERADDDLEVLAVSIFGPAEKCIDDAFGPPQEPCRVTCWHCGDKYDSSEMRLEYRPRLQGAMSEAVGDGFAKLQPLWWCRNKGCDGAGFGHDIHKVKPRKPKTPNGNNRFSRKGEKQ